MSELRSVELFGGAGGLALGCHKAGFETLQFVEWDKWACDTVRENASAGYTDVANWRVFQGDVRDVDWTTVDHNVDLVSGGPPCQPFSMGGKARAADDPRDMFPAAAEVIRELQPRALLLENVKGLTRASFANYFELIRLRLQYPAVTPRHGETWLGHLRRLQNVLTSADPQEISYKVTPNLVNAADFGVPQQRHRVFLVGFRSDVSAEWAMPIPTHSHDALLEAQWVSGEYWEEHKVAISDRPERPPRFARRIEAIRFGDHEVQGKRWRTVRDALSDMPEPAVGGVSGWNNHVLQKGARSYPGHTGSAIDEPAKTLKAGGHGVPGGENMLRRVNGSIRYFSIRESARLQTFPDNYKLHGSWGEAMRQIGNAVPVELANIVAASVADHLRHAAVRANFSVGRTA